MTAKRPEHERLSDSDPYRLREVAGAFGSEADRYDRARPAYPDAMVERVVAAMTGRDVVDVGIGTGIAARQFQAAGCRVLGVDVDARMADLARQRGFEVEISAFESWDPGGREFDAVVSGQAWHWVDPVAGAAKAAQVLRTRGRLAAFWSVFEPPPELREAFSGVYRRVLPDSRFGRVAESGLEAYSAILTKVTNGVQAVGAFDDPEQWRFEWERYYSRDDWLDQVPTFGGFSHFESDQKEALLAGIGAAIDAVGGGFVMPYTTVVVTAARISVT